MMRLAMVLLLLGAGVASASDRPTFAPRPGMQVTLERIFVDASGARATMGGFMAGRPALLVIGYQACPNMCGVTHSILAAALAKTDLSPDSYRVLFVSVDPGETAADARAARGRLAEASPDADLAPWRFLTGSGGAALAAETGMELEARERLGQYVHPIAIVALTPGGRIARVLPAMTSAPRDLRLALVEASGSRIGTLAEQVYLLCAGFDSSRGQYTPVVWAAVRLGGVATLLGLGAALAFMTWRRRR